MMEWWSSLTSVNQWFYLAGIFFGVFFVWQLVAAIIGLHGGDTGDDLTTHFDGDADHSAMDTIAQDDAQATVEVFRILSLRSILAFFTLFTWAGALYLNNRVELGTALLYALLWGLAALVIVSGLLYLMRKATESGNPDISTCVGTDGTIYLNVPAQGPGEARVTISGTVTHVRARSLSGQAIPAGTPIRVVRVLGPLTVEVEPLQPPKQ